MGVISTGRPGGDSGRQGGDIAIPFLHGSYFNKSGGTDTGLAIQEPLQSHFYMGVISTYYIQPLTFRVRRGIAIPFLHGSYFNWM